ncbi:cytochrome P450 [Thozetella sp. PMI_491]|nr:cytochrome P450 [Thozetella sp. PMI_491]
MAAFNTTSIKLDMPELDGSQLIAKSAGVALATISVFFFVMGRLSLDNLSANPLRLVHNIRSFLRKRWHAWQFLVHGPDIIDNEYKKANGKPFEVFAPDNRYVFVTSPEHIRELDTAPDGTMSQQEAAKQILLPMYTMKGFNWFTKRGVDSMGYIRTIRTLLTNHLPQLVPDLSILMKSHFDEMYTQYSSVNGVKQSPIYESIVKLVVLSNAYSFFGKDLARNEEFLTSALQYVEEVAMGAELLKLVPAVLRPYVAWFTTRRFKAQEAMFATLTSVAAQRCEERELKKLGHTVPKHTDCIQWIMETSPRENPWQAERIVHELLAIWFGSIHGIATTTLFTIHDLCLHPKYVEPLRKELRQHYTEFERSGEGLPLLDSFIRESARLSPLESMSTRRAALLPFTLSDGTQIKPNQWLCIPSRSLMQDAKYYPDPLAFHGFRFVDSTTVNPEVREKFQILQPEPAKLTEIGDTFHIWGTGRMSCPGRYYAAATMKVIVGQIIMNYSLKLSSQVAPRSWTWRSALVPKRDITVDLTPLET